MKRVFTCSSINVYQISEKEFIMIDNFLNSTIAVFQLNVESEVVFNFMTGNAYCYDLMETYQFVIERIIKKLKLKKC